MRESAREEYSVDKKEYLNIVSQVLANHKPGTKKLVYLAGPLTYPSCLGNTHRAIKKADELMAANPDWIVHIPHMNIVSELVAPKTPEFWYGYDLHFLERCDLVYRLEGFSAGADGEVALARELGIPVIFEVDDYIEEDLWP